MKSRKSLAVALTAALLGLSLTACQGDIVIVTSSSDNSSSVAETSAPETSAPETSAPESSEEEISEEVSSEEEISEEESSEEESSEEVSSKEESSKEESSKEESSKEESSKEESSKEESSKEESSKEESSKEESSKEESSKEENSKDESSKDESSDIEYEVTDSFERDDYTVNLGKDFVEILDYDDDEKTEIFYAFEKNKLVSCSLSGEFPSESDAATFYQVFLEMQKLSEPDFYESIAQVGNKVIVYFGERFIKEFKGMTAKDVFEEYKTLKDDEYFPERINKLLFPESIGDSDDSDDIDDSDIESDDSDDSDTDSDDSSVVTEENENIRIEGDRIIVKQPEDDAIIVYYFKNDEVYKIEATISCETEEIAKAAYELMISDTMSSTYATLYSDITLDGKDIICTFSDDMVALYEGMSMEVVYQALLATL